MVVPLPNHVYGLGWEYQTREDTMVANAEFWLDQDLPLAYYRRLHPKPFRKIVPYLLNGWHLSFFGGAYAVQQKLLSYVHSEYNKPPYTTTGFIKKGIWEGLDPFRRG